MRLKNSLRRLLNRIWGSERWVVYSQDFKEVARTEHDAVAGFCKGNGVDVCCGARVFPGAVGIDIVPSGETTEPWGYPSRAHFSFDCLDLPFKDGALDFLVGTHAIEHFEDPVAAVTEWLRVVKPGGHVCLIVPDRRHTPRRGHPHFDTTHMHEYSPGEFREAVSSVTGGGLADIVQFDSMDNDWSFDCIFRKAGGEPGGTGAVTP